MLLFEDFKNHNKILDKLSLNIGKEFDDYYELEWYLEDEYGIMITDDIISFDSLDEEVEKIIGNLPVKLYHFAPKKFKKDIIKEGLIKGKHRTNPYGNTYSGVYLTTRTQGKEIDSYKYHIRNTHNSDIILVEVKMYLNEIVPDPDDVDIQSGRNQFISDNISPQRIIKIEDI